jgi:hypothetical protein
MMVTLTSPAFGESHLLFFEAQGIVGYSSLQSKPIFYTMNKDVQMQNQGISVGTASVHNHGGTVQATPASAAVASQSKADMYYAMNKDAEMQKPGIGVDYLQRFSGESGDWGSIGYQGRLALIVDNGVERLEPQTYNAWLKVKTPLSDVWIGHNRPAFGLGSYLDSHPLLLRTLPLQGFGYDRDWGAGTSRDFSWGNLQLSATTGSGMPLYLNGNHLLAGRIGFGVLSEDNFTVGLSAGFGSTLETDGYSIYDPVPRAARLAGTDITLLHDSIEHRFDLLAGEWLGTRTLTAMYRFGYNFGPEQRLKVELQPTYWRSGSENWLFSACFSAAFSSALTLRTLYEYNQRADDHRIIGQLYYYLPL